MNKLINFLSIIIFCLIHSFICGWFWMMVYNLGITPFINQFSKAPQIPYILFVLLFISFTLIKSKSQDENKYKLNDIKLWARYIGGIFTNILILGMLYILNCIAI